MELFIKKTAVILFAILLLIGILGFQNHWTNRGLCNSNQTAGWNCRNNN